MRNWRGASQSQISNGKSPRSIDTSRRGVSLIQMLVVMTVLGVLSSAAITMIITTMQTESLAAAAWVNDRQFDRLAKDWRKDAHAARFAEFSTQSDVPTLIFRTEPSATRVVTYSVRQDQVQRRETDGDKLIRSETYRLPDWLMAFDVPETRGDSAPKTGDAIRLTCRRPNSTRVRRSIEQPRRDVHVLATIGRDHRFEKGLTSATKGADDAK